MEPYRRILFVCMDNTCRSIMAESVMRSVCQEWKIEVASRGLVVLFPEPMNPKAVAVLKGNQLSPCKGMSEELEETDLAKGTLTLTMTAHEKEMVLERFPRAGNVYVLGEFTGQKGDIEEPHGGTLADYGSCYEYIDLQVKLVAEILFKTRQ